MLIVGAGTWLNSPLAETSRTFFNSQPDPELESNSEYEPESLFPWNVPRKDISIIVNIINKIKIRTT